MRTGFREKDALRMPDRPITASATPGSSSDQKSGGRGPLKYRHQIHNSRGKGSRYEIVSIRVDPPVIALLDAARARRGITRSWFIADMLRAWADIEPEPEASDQECAA